MKKIQLTLAVGDYEITRPLRDGTVQAEGIDLTVLTGMDSITRHWRFLRNNEFDAAEISASSYIVSRDRDLPFRAIPVFPHRRFRHGFIYINRNKGIEKPADLIGKKIGVKAYQVTAVLWLRGMLEHEYGVPHRSIDWYSDLDEDLDFRPPEGVRLTRVRDDQSVETMLAEGELDALLHPDIIEPIVRKDPRVGRLFENPKAAEIEYYERTGIFPIMHFVGLKQEVVERHPWVPRSLAKAFEQAKAIGMKRMRNPRVAPLAWYQEALEEQDALLGDDPWEYGLSAANVKNIETLMGYSHEQGLIRRMIAMNELFLDLSEGTKRGTFRT
ncbi:ABC transporter substrate-binding protein [Paraburkholderia sp. J41]|uniref:ABC transporter substrate-binding protein n=1 Tax=Paraburkholderia sp. J41 TaxID=2805433 RepID=UPI002AC3202C|nr:ABC transporter substrate-binding protein [Paraburkholderia sp. J41]